MPFSEDVNRIVEDQEGVVGRMLLREAYSYVAPVLFGPLSESSGPTVIGGSALLIEFDGRLCAVTCAHVIDGYSEGYDADKQVRFQIANAQFDPLERLRDRDSVLDLAVLDMTGTDVLSGSKRDDYPLRAFKPLSWPPATITTEEGLFLSGYPGGKYREYGVDARDITNPSLNINGRADSVDGDGFTMQFKREAWRSEDGTVPSEHWKSVTLGGLSGCAVFVSRFPGLQLAGIVVAETPFVDGVRARSSAHLTGDGMIRRDPKVICDRDGGAY